MPEAQLHLYAVTDCPDAPLPALRDIGGAPLEAVALDGLAAVCSRVSRVEATPSALGRHEAVAEALMDDRAVLPARFGVAFGSAADILVELERRRVALSAALRRVSGRVELGLRVLRRGRPGRGPSASAGGSSRSYLERKLADRRRVELAVGDVHGPLACLAEASEYHEGGDGDVMFSAAYLVPRERVDAFRAEVDRLAGKRPDLALACTDPGPPYSFAGEGCADDRRRVRRGTDEGSPPRGPQ